MYTLLALLFGLLTYVSFVAYASEIKHRLSIYKVGLTAWRTFSYSDLKALAKGAWRHPKTLRSLYQNGYDIIFYPIVGLVVGLVCIVRNTHVLAVQALKS